MPGDKGIKKSIRAVIEMLDKEINKVDKQIKAHIYQSPTLCQKAELLESMPGIGKNTAMLLICQLPELGSGISRRAVAALAGLAPINRDSGQFRGKRTIGGGRVHVRNLLYMPTRVAIRHNPKIKDFYERLLKNGAEKMVAVTACMRKILVTLNAMATNNTMWNQNYA